MVQIAKGRFRFLRPGLLNACCVLLLTLSFAPVYQFYLAWVGLIPWLIFLAEARSKKAVFFWGWLGGTAFFVANMWWMGHISWPGMMALMTFLGFLWSRCGLLIYGADLMHRDPLAGLIGIAVVWAAFEWVRGIVFTGLPWLYLGYAQSPVLVLCQIADVTGAYGVSFWVVCVNALLALAWINRSRMRAIVPSAIVVGAMTVVVISYGAWRMSQTGACLTPGPTIAAVQTDWPQSNTGEKPVGIDERLKILLGQSIDALQKDPGKIDLIVWSETLVDALNKSARLEFQQFQDEYDILGDLCAKHDVALLTGGEYYADWHDEPRDGELYRIPADKRNTAYFFDRTGRMDDSPGHRYDKIHLVPWGEYIPGKNTMPWLYKLSMELGPNYYSDWVMQPGDILTVFHLQGNHGEWRFVTPICFEDIDARICAAMFRPDDGGAKRADFLVNLTNDGWFQANENADHLQAATFRSIENRAWMVRSVNTGISGFIDSEGRELDLLPVRTVGVSTRQIMIDSRLTFYTRFGDVFAFLCVAGAAGIWAWAWWTRKKNRPQ
jgi:apolipoprotein N-acyltransferase